MSRHNPVLAVAFSMFLIVLLFVLSPTGTSIADEVKGSDSEAGTGHGISTETVGGPDTFGYTFIDSNEPDGPEYNFIDISGTGTAAPFVNGNDDDGTTGALPVGFFVNFYGTLYSQVEMSTNGFLNFGLTGVADFSNSCPLPSPGDGPRIAVLHDDLCMNGLVPAFVCDPQPSPATAYYQTFANCPNTSGGDAQCTIFMWDNASHLGNESVQFDFEAILYDNGNILTQYAPGNPDLGDGSTTGLQNEVDSIGLTYGCNISGSISENLAVCYINPDSEKQNCDPNSLDLVDVNSGVCVFTKSVPNEIHIQGATPNKKVALIMGKGPGSFIIGGNVCNGTQLDLSQPRIVGIYTADTNGEVWAQSPVPPSGNLGKAHFQLVDVASCATNEAEQYYLVPDELPDPDYDGDGVLNCDDACPMEGAPNPMFGERLGLDGCIVTRCEEETEVSYNGSCYYLDGSGGTCLPGYMLAPQSVLNTIAPEFIGKTYKTTVSNNCCISHSDQAAEGQDWGMSDGVGSNDCNNPGPFGDGPMLNGADCTDVMQMQTNQLTLCVSQGLMY